MIVGANNKGDELNVNVTREKKLTNVQTHSLVLRRLCST